MSLDTVGCSVVDRTTFFTLVKDNATIKIGLAFRAVAHPGLSLFEQPVLLAITYGSARHYISPHLRTMRVYSEVLVDTYLKLPSARTQHAVTYFS